MLNGGTQVWCYSLLNDKTALILLRLIAVIESQIPNIFVGTEKGRFLTQDVLSESYKQHSEIPE